MIEWTNLVRASDGRPASLRRFTVLRKQGHSILYLPEGGKMAAATLRLYPAQTFFARTLIRAARVFTQIGISVSPEEIPVPIDEEGAFAQFLTRLTPGSAGVPHFGVLGGNIRVAGRRYTLLLFDAAGHPAVVVKVGLSKEARELIRVERDFFFPRPPHFSGLPEALDSYEGEDASAIAYRYVEGNCPTFRQREEIAGLLNSWIYEGESSRLGDLSIWANLEILQGENPGLKPVLGKLQNLPIKPVLFHGDFAPWNIQVPLSAVDRQWVVLDWERSMPRGVPGWDWFHYLVQYNTLVRHLTPQATVSEMEALWENPDFRAYAEKTGIQGVLKELTLVYLLYFLRFHSPRDNATRIHLFLQAFKERYFPGLVLSQPELKISVITPSYKQLPWLKLCTASVEDQRGVTVEHIIQDAQSGAELEEWVRTHTSAKLYVECDSGMYDAINRGFARATGDIVCWLNSDEQYLEGALATVARYFATHPEIDVLFGDALLASNTGALLSYRRTIAPDRRHIQASHLNTLTCATFVRRSVLERGYKLETRWKAIADAVWIAELIRAGIPMAVLNEPLAVFTITDSNLGQTSLAHSESLRWQRETESINPLFKLYYVGRHRWHKLLHGAYWPRNVTARLYNLSSPKKRVAMKARYLGFTWPHA